MSARARQIGSWLVALVAAMPFVLMLWWPAAFSTLVRLSLHSGLAVLLPLFTHTYALYVVYFRCPTRFRVPLMGACVLVSIGTFGLLVRNYTPSVLLDITAFPPAIYILTIFPFVLKGRVGGKT